MHKVTATAVALGVAATTILVTPVSAGTAQFGREPLTPAAIETTSNSHLGPLAFDGNESTAFETQMAGGKPPTWAWVRADFGKTVGLGSIRWRFVGTLAGGQYTVETSLDRHTWTSIAPPSFNRTGAWYSTSVMADVRYVRFHWRDPGAPTNFGRLAEVRFLGTPNDAPVQPAPVATAPVAPKTLPPVPSTEAPTKPGNRIRAIGSRRSSNAPAGDSRLPLDGNPATAFATAMTVPPWTAWAGYDLGSGVHIGRIRWKFSNIGRADYHRIQISNDRINWTTIGTFTNPTNADEWLTLMTDVDARYVRVHFTNINGDANLGELSEIRFYDS